MAKPHPRQLNFDGYFEVPREPEPTAGSFGFDLELRNLLARAIKECPKSRAAIAAAMTDLVFGDAGDGEITKAQIDSWTAPSHGEWRFPLCYLPAFVKATDSVWLLDRIAGRLGCKVLAGGQIMDAQIGAVDGKIAELQEHLKRLKKARRGTEG